MRVRIEPRKFSGIVRVPASKSHTIRQLLIASLADGVSEILYPLDSLDTRSCLEACRAFGAEIEEHCENGKLVKLIVKGAISNDNNRNLNQQGNLSNCSLLTEIDVGNSGTTLYLALAIAGLFDTPFLFTGDESIQKRSAAPLLDALAGVGVSAQSSAAEGRAGCAPITVQGPWKGGKVTLSCPTSQYLSAMLIASPLAPAGTVTEIDVPLLNEIPYIEMTLSYLKKHNIRYKTNFSLNAVPANHSPLTTNHCFKIPGGQAWKPFSSSVPADFSSAAFPAAAAAITGGEVTLLGLDPGDTQGDKYFFEILREMGCDVTWGSGIGDQGADERIVTISRSKPLKSGTFDLNNTPDLLPAAAAVAAFADGNTAFVNVAHARIKETDRIAVMAQELAKLGVKCTEKPDGLVVHGKGQESREQRTENREQLTMNNEQLVMNNKNNRSLNQHDTLSDKKPVTRSLLPVTCLDGHNDHRIVMALAVAALGAPSLGLQAPVEIEGAEAAEVTYPGFFNTIKPANASFN